MIGSKCAYGWGRCRELMDTVGVRAETQLDHLQRNLLPIFFSSSSSSIFSELLFLFLSPPLYRKAVRRRADASRRPTRFKLQKIRRCSLAVQYSDLPRKLHPRRQCNSTFASSTTRPCARNIASTTERLVLRSKYDIANFNSISKQWRLCLTSLPDTAEGR